MTAGWHLEFTRCRAHPVAPAPTAEDADGYRVVLQRAAWGA